jgi:hypothetical protein
LRRGKAAGLEGDKAAKLPKDKSKERRLVNDD